MLHSHIDQTGKVGGALILCRRFVKTAPSLRLLGIGCQSHAVFKERDHEMRIDNGQIHYRARFEMCPYSTTDPAIVKAYSEIYRWILGKEEKRDQSPLFERIRGVEAQKRYLDGSLCYPDGYAGGLSLNRETALATDAVMSERRGIPSAWAFEYDEPDGDLPFRHWHTRIGLSTTADGTCIVNLNVSYYTLPTYFGRKLRDPKPNIPNLMKAIVGLAEYQCNVGETTIRSSAVRLDSESFGPEFADNLLSPSRELPLILMVSDWDGRYSVGNPDKFAGNLLGMANVYVLDYRDEKTRDALFRLFPKDTPAYRYNCTAGTVRLYLPDVDLDDAEDSTRHRFFTWRDVSGYRSEDEFTEMLNRSLGRSFIKGDDDVVDIADVELLRSRREIERGRERIVALQEKLSSASERLLMQPDVSEDLPDKQQIDELKRRNEEMKEKLQESKNVIAEYDESNLNLAKLLKEAKESNVRLNQELAESRGYKTLVSEATERARKWQAEASGMRERFDFSSGLPGFFRNVKDELELAEKLWGGRIVVLDEAYRSAKDYKAFDLEEEWKIISAAANDLWDICFDSDLDGIIDDVFYQQTGVELAMTEGPMTRSNPQMMKLRDRTYLGKTVRCEPHLKGRGRGVPSEFFRLHFYIDRENKKIVIGHCGLHLKSAATLRQ